MVTRLEELNDELVDDLADAEDLWRELVQISSRTTAWWASSNALVHQDLAALADDVVSANREHWAAYRRSRDRSLLARYERHFNDGARLADAALLLAPWHPTAVWVAGNQPGLDNQSLHQIAKDCLAELWDDEAVTRPLNATKELLWAATVALTGVFQNDDEATAKLLLLIMLSGPARVGEQTLGLATGYIQYWVTKFNELPSDHGTESTVVPLRRTPRERSTQAGPSARRAAKTAPATARSVSKKSAARPRNVDATAVREWARGNGIEVAPRGPIPGQLMEQFLARQQP